MREWLTDRGSSTCAKRKSPSPVRTLSLLGMKGPFLVCSVETAIVRKSGCWICGVTEEEEVLCGKAVDAMWVFPHIQFNLSFKRSHINSQQSIVKGKPYVYTTCIL